MIQRAHRVACSTIATNLAADAAASGEGTNRDTYFTAPADALDPWVTKPGTILPGPAL